MDGLPSWVVSGAHDFEIGNPVRARIVQNLRNQTAKINLPQLRKFGN